MISFTITKEGNDSSVSLPLPQLGRLALEGHTAYGRGAIIFNVEDLGSEFRSTAVYQCREALAAMVTDLADSQLCHAVDSYDVCEEFIVCYSLWDAGQVRYEETFRFQQPAEVRL
ncbi:MAG: hypothetical protein ACI9DF_004099 [Verrucomicrobiales bacterium]|jgi:hypothetical protein